MASPTWAPRPTTRSAPGATTGYAGYKTDAGMPPELLAQFPLRRGCPAGHRRGALADGRVRGGRRPGCRRGAMGGGPGVERVVILSPDKDMAQCVREDGRVVTYDRRKRSFVDADGVREKFGVSPASIPDFLALVGDSSDGYPGIPGWGAVSTAAVLRRYPHLEDIPDSVGRWDVSVRGAASLAVALRERHERGAALPRARPASPRRAHPAAGGGRAALAGRAAGAVRGARRAARGAGPAWPGAPLGRLTERRQARAAGRLQRSSSASRSSGRTVPRLSYSPQ